ncbi:MAG TPA: class I SAM-dependent methyltransferase [Solirubrobacterales bacterium]
MESVSAANQEATDAWSGPLFERFTEYRELVADGLGAHGEAALASNPPPEGARVLDLGCGWGDTTQRLAEIVGPKGAAVGLDVAAPFIEVARGEAEDGPGNVEFAVADVQVDDLGGDFDYAFSRMGLMFFANPVQALRNIRSALVPGGRLVSVAWRRKPDNEWLHCAELVVEQYLEHPEETDEPTCGPGPFSMANADTVSDQLRIAGFERISLRRSDLPLKIGSDLDEAVAFNMAIGPAAEVLRLWGDRVEEIRPKIAADLRRELAGFVTPDGVYAPASTWIVTAVAPG